MQIVGVEVGGGSPVFSYTLAHGEDPHQRAWEEGYKVTRPLSATGTVEDLTVTLQVTPHGRRVVPRGPQRTRTLVRGLRLDDIDPVRRQRLAAYALIVSDRGILATEFSERTAVPGMWSLPGGGIDAGENPSQTVQREVYEETGQHAVVRQFIDIQTDHWIGLAPNGTVEDFHAVRLIYAATCHWPNDPVVHDAGGTTADSAWISPERWRELPWSTGAKSLLTRHAPTQIRLWRWEKRQRLA
ncbi:NUDIX hydrolase [Nigerium massiliense]|uniref:NUDIX hydrolase n=1 Tax=Nigerium massiliense TaxID=1522317 RepID=UPI000907C1DE|nr:NUDIX domain-containing protein [Nigerium massiliense]